MVKDNKHNPPKWANRFLEWYCAPHQLDDVQGALYEYYHERVKNGEVKKARRMFWLDVLTHFRPHIIKRNKTRYQSNNTIMFKNFAKIAARSLWKHKLTSVLNVLGLTIGIICFLMIMIWVRHEKSFDSFHENSDNIYRIVCTYNYENESLESKTAVSTPALGVQLPRMYAQVINGVRYTGESFSFKVGNQIYFEDQGKLIDPSFFEMFSWEAVAGDPKNFFDKTNSIVLTETLAKKYFGDKPAMGELLIMDDDATLEVTGVLKDPPSNSQFQFSALISVNSIEQIYNLNPLEDVWDSGGFRTYLQVEPGTDPEALMTEFNTYMRSKLSGHTDRGVFFHHEMQRLTDIHLHSDLRFDYANNGSARNVALFTAVAFITLLLACINYINLTTANAIKRAKEVGIKKVIGALRSHLIAQFLVESVLISIFSMLLALGFVYLLLPGFEVFVGYEMAVKLDASILIWLFSGTLILGLLAGFVPALAISSFRTLSVLKGQLNSGKRGTLIRKSLVVVQFTATIALIIGIVTINSQMRHLQQQELGMNTDEVININYRGLGSVNKNQQALANQLLKHPVFKAVSFNSARSYPVGGLDSGPVEVELTNGDMISSNLHRMYVDDEYANAYDLKMVSGRFFSNEFPNDSTQSVVVNEAAVTLFGWESTEAALGKKINEQTVIGVVEDFNFEGLHKEVGALRILRMRRNSSFSRITLKADLSEPSEPLRLLEETWREVNADVPLNYTIMNDDIERQYQAELRFRTMFLIFSVLSVLIASLGLFGLATAAINQRLKEIGIRKVLGASAAKLVRLVSFDFFVLIAISLVLAIPFAWYGMEQWLSGFAYRIEMSWFFVIAAGAVAIGISFISVSYQALSAALGNPIKSLRNE